MICTNFKDNIVMIPLIFFSLLAFTLVVSQEHIKTVSGSAFYLQEPSSLSRVLKITLHSDSDDLVCKRIGSQLFAERIREFKLRDYHSLA